MGYKIAALASYIIKNHKADLVMLDCKTMPELVTALKDEAFAQTAIMVFDLKESDFLEESPPTPTQEVVELKPAEVKIPNIFKKQEVKKPVMIDNYQALECYMRSVDPLLKFEDSDKIEFVGNFLHTSLFDTKTEVGKQDHHVAVNEDFADSAEWITAGGNKPDDGNLFSGYKNTSHVNKAKSKAFNLLGHVFNMIVTALFMLKSCKHIADTYGENSKDLYKKLFKLGEKVVNSQWEDLETSEKNWLSLNIWAELFTLTKNKEGNTNLYKSYSNCLWVGTGNNTYKPLPIDADFFKDLESDGEPAPDTKPAPITKPTPPAFKAPEGTQEVIKILVEVGYLPATVTCNNDTDLKAVRNKSHLYITTMSKLDSDDLTGRDLKRIKLIENWLSA